MTPETSLKSGSEGPTQEISPPIDEPPKVPPKNEKPNFRPVYNMKSPMAAILMFRQSDLNAPLTISSAADVYMNEKVDLRLKTAQSAVSTDGFWHDFVDNYTEAFMKEQDAKNVENHVVSGIPSDLRCAIYFTLLNIKSVVETQTYESLVKKAKLADFEGGKKDKDPDPAHAGELLQVFWYCLKGSPHANIHNTGLLSVRLIERLARVIQYIENMTKAEVLTTLFKVTEQYAHFSKSEFSYKGSRALEELNRDVFVHVTKQGIDIAVFFEMLLEKIFDVSVGEEVCLGILDMLLFEGPDYLLRLVCAYFSEQQKQVVGLDTEELNSFIHSQSLFSKVSRATLEESLKVEIPIIKYENEFSLMNANSISGNDNEVSNLKETKQDLTLKLSDLKEKYLELEKTHEEIFGQNAEYAKKLAVAREERESLLQRKELLQQKYSQLTMQENLSNTIKANRDISRENQDLEQQIQEMQKKVEEKSKLAK